MPSLRVHIKASLVDTLRQKAFEVFGEEDINLALAYLLGTSGNGPTRPLSTHQSQPAPPVDISGDEDLLNLLD